MKFEYGDGTLVALLEDPKQRVPHRRDLSSICVLNPRDVRRIAEATRKCLTGKRHSTQSGSLSAAFSRFGQYLVDRTISQLPNNFDDWQFTVIDFYAWYLSHAGTDAMLETRVTQWDGAAVPWLRGLIDEGVLPFGLVLPASKFHKEVAYHGSPRNPALIGEAPAKPTEPEKPINKTLAGPIFWLNDTDYLDEVESRLRQRNELLARVADDHWNRLVRDFRHGKNMLREISSDALKSRIDQDRWTVKIPAADSRFAVARVKVTSPRSPACASWVLRTLTHLLEQSGDPSCLATGRLQKHPAFLSHFLHSFEDTPISPFLERTALRTEQKTLLEFRTLILRFLGILTPVDMAVACTILIQEHPNLNIESLTEARLLDAHGKRFVLVTDDARRTIFSVDKPRAGKRKYAALSHRAQRVIDHLVRATALVRRVLKAAGDKHWRYLFLGFSGSNANLLCHPFIRPRYLYDPVTPSLGRLYPELAAGGLGEGTLDFAKLRATQGVLEWFRTGSLREASRKMGNSHRVVIDHYIPPPLLRLWNERIIRRFQNALILLAARNESYLLGVTDFRTYGELQDFVSQCLSEYHDGRSPIGSEFHRLFGAKADLVPEAAPSESVDASKDAILTLRIGGESLAMLYALQRVVLTRMPADAIDRQDPRTGLTPKHFVDLATLLTHAAESETVGEALSETLQRAHLVRAHQAALPKVPQILAKLEHLRIEQQWS